MNDKLTIKEFIQKTKKLKWKVIKHNFLSHLKNKINETINKLKSEYIDYILFRKILLDKLKNKERIKLKHFGLFELNDELFLETDKNIELLKGIDNTFKFDFKTIIDIKNNDYPMIKSLLKENFIIMNVYKNKNDFYIGKFKQIIWHPILLNLYKLKYKFESFLNQSYLKLEKLNKYDNIIDEIEDVVKSTTPTQLSKEDALKIKTILDKLKIKDIIIGKNKYFFNYCIDDSNKIRVTATSDYNHKIYENYNHNLYNYNLYKFQLNIELLDENKELLITYIPFVFDEFFNIRVVDEFVKPNNIKETEYTGFVNPVLYEDLGIFKFLLEYCYHDL